MKYRGTAAPIVKAQEAPPAGPPAFKVYVDQYFETKAAAQSRWQATTKAIGEGVGEQLRPLIERIKALESEVETIKRSHDLEVRLARLEGKRDA